MILCNFSFLCLIFLNKVVGILSQAKGKYVPSWVKVKYGAWYLNPRTWKARPKDEPLQDPKDQQDKILSESKKKSQKLVILTWSIDLN